MCVCVIIVQTLILGSLLCMTGMKRWRIMTSRSNLNLMTVPFILWMKGTLLYAALNIFVLCTKGFFRLRSQDTLQKLIAHLMPVLATVSVFKQTEWNSLSWWLCSVAKNWRKYGKILHRIHPVHVWSVYSFLRLGKIHVFQIMSVSSCFPPKSDVGPWSLEYTVAYI